MKLNQRDKIILIGVLVVLIWICGVIFFIKPSIEKVSSASETLDAKEMELASLQAQIKEDENLPQEVDEAYDNASEIADVFYDKMQQHAVATEVQTQLDNDSIKNLNLAITSEISTISLSRYVYNRFPQETAIDVLVDSVQPTGEEGTTDDGTVSASTEIEASVELSNYALTFNYQCTKGDLLKFIQDIQTNSQRSLVVSSLTIADIGDNESNTEIAGTMSLDFMMIPDIPDPEDIDNSKATEVNATEE